MKKITKVAFLSILLISLFSGCRTADKPQSESKVSSESETSVDEKETESANNADNISNGDLPELSLTGQLAEDIAQLCELEKDRGTAVEAHDIDGESAIISFWSKESQSNFASYSYILSEKQELVQLKEFSSSGSWANLKLTPGGAQGYNREEKVVTAFSWQDRQIMSQEKIVAPEESLYAATPNLWYAYTDDFKQEAFVKSDEHGTQELIIKDLDTGAEKVIRTYQTDGAGIKQILWVTDFYFLNSNQLFYVGPYYPAEGKQSQQGYGIIDLESEQNDSLYEGDVMLRSETGCIVVLEGENVFGYGTPTGKVLIYQRENDSWITLSLPEPEKLSYGACISRSGKYLLVEYIDRTTKMLEGRLFESATGKIILTMDMRLEDGTEKMIDRFCILEDQEELLYVDSDGTTEIINFGGAEE